MDIESIVLIGTVNQLQWHKNGAQVYAAATSSLPHTPRASGSQRESVRPRGLAAIAQLNKLAKYLPGGYEFVEAMAAT